MNIHYLPVKFAAQVIWLNNYKLKIAVHSTALGLTATQLADEVQWCEDVIAAINNIETKSAELKSARSAKTATDRSQLAAIRANIARHKVHIDYTPAIGSELGIVSNNTGFDPTTYKAALTVEIFGGHVRIKFTKRGADGINLYHRKKTAIEWGFLARINKSPFDNHIVLAIPNQPEHWEYRAFGVVDDEEVGIASDIVEVVYAG
jgi:hypothetical protein